MHAQYYIGCDVVFESEGAIRKGYTLYSENLLPGLNCDDYAPIRFIMPEVRAAFPQLDNVLVYEPND